MKDLKIRFDFENDKVILNRNPISQEEAEQVRQAFETVAIRRFLKNPPAGMVQYKEEARRV